MDSTQGEQTQLVCRSEGWSPEPEVIWRDRDGNNVTSLSNTTVQRDSQGLLSVSSYIKVKQQSNVFSCLVRSKIHKPDWESKLHISSDFFPGVSGWKVAFFLTLALSIGAIPLLVIQWRRMDRKLKMYEVKEWKWILSSAAQFFTAFNLNFNITVFIFGNGYRKKTKRIDQIVNFLVGQAKLAIYKSRKNRVEGKGSEDVLSMFKILVKFDVTLDPDTAQPRLILSAEGKRVRWRETRQDLHDNPERFDIWHCVLGREGFTSGRRYWQVQVGGNTNWALGVSRESAKRKGEISLTPQQGYWTVDWSGGEFTALTDPRTPLPRSLKPQKLGVYLDYEEGQLSFYNVDTRSHIYTFTDMEFNPNKKLYPLFWTEDEDTDLVLESPDPDPVSAAD
ncbi:UNVERIFIED_CONTAM: hypothetical protein FKN15_071632 [Acipenser sinensis]